MVVRQKRSSLTKRQKEIYEFLKDKIENRGYGPTVREIGIHFNISSPNGVICHLKALERKGLIQRESHMSRAICLAETTPHRGTIPLIGTAVPGHAIRAAVSSEDRVSFSDLLEGVGRACLKICGSSFKGLGINDGDFVILNRADEGGNGDLVAVLDDSHCVTFCRAQSSGVPISAIEKSDPVLTRQILGTVVGVVRRFADSESTETCGTSSTASEPT
ncbi:MAG: transcriptional repressor LexA [Planctomycetaceae bacterium]|nr:transcriptional repressor LexA [Planctomycetaceae bacterium]